MKNFLFRSLKGSLFGAVWWLSTAGSGWAAPGGGATVGAAGGNGVGTGTGGGMGGGRAGGGGFTASPSVGAVRGVSPGFAGGGANVGGARIGGAAGSGFRSVSPGASVGVSAPATGGVFRSVSPGASVGAPASVTGGYSVGRSGYPSRSVGPARPGNVAGARTVPGNAWTDPRVGRTATPAARVGRYGYGNNGAYDAGQASLRNRLTPGQHLYQGSYNYPAVTSDRNRADRDGSWRNRQWDRSYHHHYYGAYFNPYYYTGLAYPYFYGGYFGGFYDNGYSASLSVDNSEPSQVPNESARGYWDRDDSSARSDDGPAEEESSALPPNPPARVGPENPAASEQKKQLENGPDSLVEAVQGELARRGYFAGKVDAIYGEPTREALRRFQTDRRLAVTGRINEATLHALELD